MSRPLWSHPTTLARVATYIAYATSAIVALAAADAVTADFATSQSAPDW